ncbi:ArsR/SmtB family transcription factor [Dietzia sp. 179-F 9C3 NHS]|uniref:ArsR/SmtB family transcription factor n=1 Tax=Dietzia sp. 179-F 9C3 NHS TaxID=3374295 RepID=UPI0038791401
MTKPHAHHPPATIDLPGWATRFDLLGDPTRLALLAHMHDAGPGVATVSDLATAAGITRNAASQALRVLRDQGWVRADRDPTDGRAQRYTLADDTVHTILHLMGARHD